MTKKKLIKEKVGRKTTYNKKIGELICQRLSTSRHGLGALCKMHKDMPDQDTVYMWRIRHPEFAEMYLNAKLSQIELRIEQLDEVVDENVQYYSDEKGQDRIDSPSVAIATLKCNNKKWEASKLFPRKYGNSLLLEEKTEENERLKVELLELRAKLDEGNKKEY